MNGLYLQGGGAKGAFEAGAIYALREAGLTFSIVSGTSIGSINGYYLYMGQEEAMKRFYTECDLMPVTLGQIITDTIPNELLIYRLRQLSRASSDVKSFYVNYVHIENCQKTEVRKDLAKEDKVSQLKAITASSLLPFSLPDGLTSVPMREVASKYGNRVMGPYFDADVEAGKYENRDLDGGILNNYFMEPFAVHRVDKLYLISLHDELPIPSYLRDVYKNEQLILIEREKPFSATDSLNFSQPFMRDLFFEGYEKAKSVLSKHKL